MWWKLYFWILVIVIGLGVFAFLAEPSEVTPLIIFDLIVSGIGLIGMYSYIYTKKVLPSRFWLFFFWGYAIYVLLYILVALFPDIAIASYLQFLLEKDEEALPLIFIDAAIELSILYVIYQIAHNKFLTKSEKPPKMVPTKTAPKWGMAQTALWGYNTIFTGILFAFTFFPVDEASSEASDPISISILFGPLLLFWILVVMQYKKYTWNWWKMTLAANSIFYAAIIIFGLFSIGSYEPVDPGFDIIGVAQIGILFISLIIFGREQFKPVKK